MKKSSFAVLALLFVMFLLPSCKSPTVPQPKSEPTPKMVVTWEDDEGEPMFYTVKSGDGWDHVSLASGCKYEHRKDVERMIKDKNGVSRENYILQVNWELQIPSVTYESPK